MKKALSLLLLCAILASFAPSCAKNAESSETGETPDVSSEVSDTESGVGGVTETAGDETTEAESYSFQDMETVDYDGYIFRNIDIPMDGSPEMCFYYAEESGDMVEDAIYKRDLLVAEKYNIGFSSSMSENYGTAYGYLKKTQYAGEDAFDTIMTVGSWAFKCVMDGVCYTADELVNLDYSKDYYAHFANSQTNINGTQVLAFSKLCLLPYTLVDCVHYDLQVAEDYKIEDMYSLADSGKWTFDKFYELANSVVTDLDGDGSMTQSDMWGFGSESSRFYSAMWGGAGTKLVQTDDSGSLYSSLTADSGFLDAMKYVRDNTIGKNVGYVESSNAGYDVFLSGHSLFSISNLPSGTSSQSKEGILPIPKFDEEQENYYCPVCDAWIYCVSTTNPDPDRVSMIMEALTCATEDIVWPVYSGKAMAYKTLTDDGSRRMYLLIEDSLSMDFGTIMWHDIGDAVNAYIFDPSADIDAKTATVGKMTDSMIKSCNQTLETRVSGQK